LSSTYFIVQSLTFKNLPFKGNTPNLSLPTTWIPLIASDLAESPSVKIKVQYSDSLVPASLASSSFGIPRSFSFFFPVPRFLLIDAASLAYINDTMLSMIPLLATYLKNLSLSSHEEPN
jgi:hypothetical protein